MENKKLLLIIMDGYGLASKSQNNAILNAYTPHLDEIFKNNPTIQLSASGVDVGLPENQMGNSEVGHTNIGAGRVVYQDFSYINQSIKNKEFENNKILNNIIENVIKTGSCLHIMGLLSDGGIHSHVDHLYELIKMAKNKGLKKIFIHVWTDGRDTNPGSGISYIEKLKDFLNNIGIGKIATICGRYYAMDRDQNIDRTQVAVNSIFNLKGEVFSDPVEFIKKSYSLGVSDEFILPGIYDKYSGIDPKDSVICFNFRPDRVRQITNLVKNKVRNYVCFTCYDKNFKDVYIAFLPRRTENTLGEYLSNLGFKQLRVAETEKYAHVTFFLNAGAEKPYAGEDRIIVNSPKVKTYDLKPEMSAFEVTNKVLEKMKLKKYDFIAVNFANPDMVGHTGNFKATVKAVETVDECVFKLVEFAKSLDMAIIITADHGNAEKMADEQGNIFTAHTCNKVPFSVINYRCTLKKGDFALCNIAPTICEIMGIEKPAEMLATSLIQK